jgi:hypothetical protein
MRGYETKLLKNVCNHGLVDITSSYRHPGHEAQHLKMIILQLDVVMHYDV